MRPRARALLLASLVAPVSIACSLITDYSLDVGRGDASAPTEGGPGGEAGPPSDAGGDVVVNIPDADAGPTCTAKPCVVQIAAAVQNTCARLDDGSVKCWGWNNTGVVGAPEQGADFATPHAVALSGPADELALGGWPIDYPTACVRRGGSIECWGADGGDHMLGRGAASNGQNFNPLPAAVANLSGASGGIAIGGKRVCARVGDGLACWGDDYTSTQQNGVVQKSATPLAAPKPVRQVVPGRTHHCVLFDSEEVGCVGAYAFFGPLWNAQGYGRGPGGPTIELVAGVTGIAQLAMQSNHLCMLTKTGEVKCGGRNSRGELGRGTTTDFEDAPVTVVLPRPAKTIGTGNTHSCAILDDDTVWCWGSNGIGNGSGSKPYKPRGQIGLGVDGGLDNRSTVPREVKGLPAGGKLQVVGGYAHTCVLMKDGSMYCFGKNDHGQLGIGAIDGGTPTDGGVGDDDAHPIPQRVVF